METLKKIQRRILIFFFLYCSACTALTEKTGQLMEEKLLGEKILDRYAVPEDTLLLQLVKRKKAGEEWKMNIKAWPTLHFYFFKDTGSSLHEHESFIPLSCSFLSPGLSGWNEFTLDLTGEGTITAADKDMLTVSVSFIEVIDMAEGRIRRGDVRISGSEALDALKNRRERIEALTEWMHAQNGEEIFSDQKIFENYWKPILLPELCSAKKRPALYQSNGAQRVHDGDVRWNTAYTALLFPEELRPLRDSGSLLRDWEEAAAWIYLSYEWNSIIKTITEEQRFIKIKK
ncbi:MAG: hypothetical protein FWG27_03500 [Treponema sp.]|jgi:hypothetical protein|nr:hypothetical protein [Treponema sp.]